MKIKKGFNLRVVCDENIIVAEGLSNIDFSRIAREIALGTGFGLRYDLSVLVIRFDVGVGIHAPYNTGHSGYYNMGKFWNSLGFHLAVGYPF